MRIGRNLENDITGGGWGRRVGWVPHSDKVAVLDAELKVCKISLMGIWECSDATCSVLVLE